MQNKQIIFFDEVCFICNNFVRLIIKLDKKEIFAFASLQGQTAKKLIDQKMPHNTQSVILKAEDKIYIKSIAILKIGSQLKGFYFLSKIAGLIPVFISDKIYDFLAANRYKWFKKLRSCPLKKDSLAKRLLD